MPFSAAPGAGIGPVTPLLARLRGVPNLTPGDAQDLLARYKSGWERRDPDALMELFADNAEFRPGPFDGDLSGANAIRAYWNDFAAGSANNEFDAERTWAVGATVLASFHAAYTRRADGGRVRLRGFMTLELDDDRRVTRLRQWPVERLVGSDSTFKVEA
jgi:ketosteroid isomerase-like protein